MSRCHQVKVCLTSLSGFEWERKKEVVDSNQLIIDTGSSGRMEERAKCTARVGKWAIEIGATRRNKKNSVVCKVGGLLL